MAHFAKLDDNDTVLEVNSVDNRDINNLPFPESEAVGVEFLTQWSNGYKNWKQTSYNKTFRKNYAGIGYTYNADIDAFVPPQPFPSWVLDTDSAQWNAPVAMPEEGRWSWDEDASEWVESNV